MYFKPYRYVKAPPKKKKASGKFSLLFDEFFPLGLIFLGSFILSTQIVIPFISFPSGGSLLRPTGRFFAGGEILGEVSGVEGLKNREEKRKKNIPPIFFLSIPKLRIEKARVKTDTREPDPRDFLGHFLGSALPGEEGVVFIYGHSTFPWLFDPEDYLTIFSTLPKLENGDKITLSYNDNSWEYVVEGFKTLDPGKVDLSSFQDSNSRLILMTCVPPGTRLKRFLVFASLSQMVPSEAAVL